MAILARVDHGLLPQLLGEAPRRRHELLRAEPLVQQPLLVARGAEEHERLRDAPRLVELVLGAIQARQRLEQLDAIGGVREQELQLRDRLHAPGFAGLEIQICELLVARHILGRELARHLVRLRGGLGVAQVEQRVAELRPQLEQGLRRRLLGDREPLQLAAVRAGEVLVVLALLEQLLDTLERLRRLRRVVERGVELLDREIHIRQLVARDDRGRVVEARPPLGRGLHGRERVERLDRAAPLLLLRERLEDLVQQHARLRREPQAHAVRVDRLLRVAQSLAPEIADLLEQLRAAFLGARRLHEGLGLGALRVDDRPPLATGPTEIDERAERGLVQRILLERPAIARLRLLVVAERARCESEAVPDLGHAIVRDVAMAREHIAIAPVDLGPLLGRDPVALVGLRLGHQHGREADRRVQAIGVELDGIPVVLCRLLGAVQRLVRAPEQALAPAALRLVGALCLTREHLEHG